MTSNRFMTEQDRQRPFALRPVRSGTFAGSGRVRERKVPRVAAAGPAVVVGITDRFATVNREWMTEKDDKHGDSSSTHLIARGIFSRGL
jgi:hypothetical protein